MLIEKNIYYQVIGLEQIFWDATWLDILDSFDSTSSSRFEIQSQLLSVLEIIVYISTVAWNIFNLTD